MVRGYEKDNQFVKRNPDNLEGSRVQHREE